MNKATLLEKIADLVKDKKIDGIADLRDESDRDGMRIYIEIKRDANPHKVLNNLFKHTPMQTAFNLNMLALVDGQPQTLPLKSVLQHYVDHRREIVRRRTEFDLEKARARAHILEGLKIALDNLDAVIRTIRESADVEAARDEPDDAVRAVRAPGAGDPRHAPRPPGGPRAQEDRGRVPRGHPADRRARGHPRQSGPCALDHQGRARRLKRKYAGERRTRVVDDSNRELTDEDLIADEDVVVTISRRGYIKRQPVATYRRQHRGGKGIIGHVTREEDAVEHLLVANTHDWALFFTNRGRVFSAKVHAIPDASRQAKGMAIINLPGVQVETGEVPMATIVPVRLRARALPGDGDAARDHQEDAARAVRAGPRDRASGRSRSARATSSPGSVSPSGRTTSSSPRHRACSPGSPRTRSGRWAATRPA